MTDPECDMCAIDTAKLVRFSLIAPGRTPDGRKTTRGAGAITLCHRCWQQLRAKRRQKRRSTARLTVLSA